MEPEPTARGCLLLHKALGRHREGIKPFDSVGKGQERCLWKEEEEARAKALPRCSNALSPWVQTLLRYLGLPG